MVKNNIEKYYPLRPEFVESTLYLYVSTKDPHYLHVGEVLYESLMNVSRVEGGFANIRNVETKEREDRMSSFFLAETCKYLYLLFDSNNYVLKGNYIFSTESHLFPVFLSEGKDKIKATCSIEMRDAVAECHVRDNKENYQCTSDMDCGIDSVTCKWRRCSQFGYCYTPQ